MISFSTRAKFCEHIRFCQDCTFFALVKKTSHLLVSEDVSFIKVWPRLEEYVYQSSHRQVLSFLAEFWKFITRYSWNPLIFVFSCSISLYVGLSYQDTLITQRIKNSKTFLPSFKKCLFLGLPNPCQPNQPKRHFLKWRPEHFAVVYTLSCAPI